MLKLLGFDLGNEEALIYLWSKLEDLPWIT